MARYIKNPAGAVHSVADDYTFPEDWAEDSWSEIDEAEARTLAPTLFGADDPDVLRHRLSDERSADPADDAVPGPEAEATPEVAS